MRPSGRKIIINLRGGLGNQMFEYAFGRGMSLERNIPLALDTQSLSKDSAQSFYKDTSRTFKLDAFNLSARILTQEESLKARPSRLKTFLGRVRRKIFPSNPYKFKRVSPVGYHDGEWHQNEKYFIKFDDAIRSDFELKRPLGEEAKKWHDHIEKNKIAGIHTVSLHVRGGDYLTNKFAQAHHGTASPSYYGQALTTMTERLHGQIALYVFTDDIPFFNSLWKQIDQKLTARFTPNIVSSTPMQDFEEQYLMSLCENNIIANSSFSWWAAWLNRNRDKIITAPKQWVNDRSIDTSDVCPKDWIRL